jgi:hypothetical protein
MTSVWPAADAFSNLWLESPHTELFRSGLKPTKHHQHQPFQANSVHAIVGMYSLLECQPLLLGKRLSRVPEFEQLRTDPEVARWFEVAQRFAFSLVEIVEFLRSRLPGYPGLLVPDLLPAASRVYADGFWDMRFPWEQEVRTARLHFESQPSLLARALALPDAGREAYAALTALGRALHETATWKRFAAAHGQLTSADRDAAKANRRQYRELANEERVEAIAGGTGLRCANMRRAELEQVKRRAEGTLRDYYDAFDAVDALIDAVAAFISHRVANGTFDALVPFEADWGPPEDLRAIRLKAPDHAFRRPYEMAKMTCAVRELSGIVLLQNLNIRFMEGILTADGRLLVGSDAVPLAATPKQGAGM